MPDFKEVVQQRRAEITKLIADVDTKIATLRADREKHQLELNGLDAYERTVSGQAAPRRASTTPGAKGAGQATLMSMIQGSGNSMTRAQILDAVGIKGDKKAEARVSSSLAAMKKAGKVTLKDGNYTVAA